MKRLTLCLALISILSFSLVTISLAAPAVHPAGVKAALVKGYAITSGWTVLNSTWPSYGTTPIVIDTTLATASSFTYQDLVNTAADVLILSDPAGELAQYSTDEIAAVARYASEGHNVIGTFVTFQWGSVDNRGLATIFGLRSDIAYNTTEVTITNAFTKVDSTNRLFKGIPGTSWTSTGYAGTQEPAPAGTPRAWNPVTDFAGANLVAQCDANKAIITTYQAASYWGIYISNMPEFGGGMADKQLLYNAITYPPPGTVKAALVKGYPNTGAWTDLSSSWPSHGTTPIVIDTTLATVSSFTYQDLVNTAADVLIISDPSGVPRQYTTDEIAAVARYASEGHNVIGTYLTFQWDTTDNRGLAPIFGLRSDITYYTTSVSITNVFSKVDSTEPLFKGISGTSWTSTGYAKTQEPAPGGTPRAWNPATDLAGARIVAQCDSYKGIITTFDAVNYAGIYISNMPEYYGGTTDLQLLYNAITYGHLSNGVATDHSLTGASRHANWNYYYFDVPAGAKNLTVDLYNLSNDADLYVSRESKPNLNVYDCRPYIDGLSSEQCSWSTPASGRWYIGITNWSTGTINYTIRAKWTVSKALVDFNADGKDDLVWQYGTTGSLDVWYLNGATVTGDGWLPAVSDPNWQLVGIGDFNGNGNADLLWRHSSGALNLWYMNGVTIASDAWLPAVSDPQWKVAGIGDFNGDGRADILWRYGTAGAMNIWFMNGSTVTSDVWLPPVSDTTWQIAGVGDFNGDGSADILWRNTASGDNDLWFLNNGIVMTDVWLPRVSDLLWKIAAIGDFNGDGKADIVWRYGTAGPINVWFFDGITVTGDGWLPTVSDPLWHIVGPK